jgi:hypothetical protein
MGVNLSAESALNLGMFSQQVSHPCKCHRRCTVPSGEYGEQLVNQLLVSQRSRDHEMRQDVFKTMQDCFGRIGPI